MAEIVRRRSWGGVLPLGRHVSISGSRSIHAPSVSIAPSSFQEEQNARHHKQFKLEQALNRVYFEKRSFSSSGSRVSLTQRRSAMTKGSRFRRTSKSATRRVRSSALGWQ